MTLSHDFPKEPDYYSYYDVLAYECCIGIPMECCGLLCLTHAVSINTCLYLPMSLQLPAGQYYLIQVLSYNQSAPAYM